MPQERVAPKRCSTSEPVVRAACDADATARALSGDRRADFAMVSRHFRHSARATRAPHGVTLKLGGGEREPPGPQRDQL